MNFTKEKFQELSSIKDSENPCISLFIPTERDGNPEKFRIRFKNGLQKVEADLQTHYNMAKPNALKYLASAYNLYDNERFWSNQSDGLAIFLKGDHFEYFTVPEPFHEEHHVGNQFHLSPMLPLLSDQKRFFILALSQNEVQFFEGRENSIYPVKISDIVPTNMEMALNEESEPTLQAHSGNNTGNINNVFHGQGAGEDEKKEDLRRYFNIVDKGLMEMLYDEKAPLVLACVDYYVPIYQDVSNYSNVHSVNISGNAENTDPISLHNQAWEILEDHFNQEKTEMTETFGNYLAEGKANSFNMDVIPAAINGRVATLWVAKDTHTFGSFDRETNKIKIDNARTKDNRCLLDWAATQTYLQGGNVYYVSREEMPQPTSNVNAILRF